MYSFSKYIKKKAAVIRTIPMATFKCSENATHTHKSQLDFDPNEHCIYFANQISKSFIHFNNSDSF